MLIEPAARYDGSAEVLSHLRRECERTGFKLSADQTTAFHDLDDGPDERALSFLHAWWCYDSEKLLKQQNHTRHPRPRIYLSIDLNQRGRLILSWSPLARVGDDFSDSDFRRNPCLPYTKENRLIEVREFRSCMIFHDPPELGGRSQSLDLRAGVPPNEIISNGLLLHAAAALIDEIKKRLAHCFTVTMVDDVYVEWEPDPARKWEFKTWLKTFAIKRVAVHEAEQAGKLLYAFETTYGCSLERFAEVAFAPDEKPKSGPLPSPHTKAERSARRFKALGLPKLTPSVVRQYVDILQRYRTHLIPAKSHSAGNVLPFGEKK